MVLRLAEVDCRRAIGACAAGVQRLEPNDPGAGRHSPTCWPPRPAGAPCANGSAAAEPRVTSAPAHDGRRRADNPVMTTVVSRGPRLPGVPRARREGDGGFTLVEVVISMVLLSLVISSVGVLFVAGIRHGAGLQRRQVAVSSPSRRSRRPRPLRDAGRRAASSSCRVAPRPSSTCSGRRRRAGSPPSPTRPGRRPGAAEPVLPLQGASPDSAPGRIRSSWAVSIHSHHLRRHLVLTSPGTPACARPPSPRARRRCTACHAGHLVRHRLRRRDLRLLDVHPPGHLPRPGLQRPRCGGTRGHRRHRLPPERRRRDHGPDRERHRVAGPARR